MVSASGSLSFQAGVFATSLLIGDRVAPDSSSPEELSVRYGVDALSARVYFVELAGTLSVNWTGRAAFHSAYRVVFTFIAPTGSPFRRTFTPSGPCPRRLGSIRNFSESCWRRQERCRSADGNCLFDAQRGSSIAREGAAATLSVRRAGEYLNAPRVQRGMLYRAGLIAPRVRGADHGCRPVCARGPGRLSRSAAGWRRARGGGRSRLGRQSGRGQTVLPLGEHGNRSEREGCGPSAEDRNRFARVSFGRAWRPSAMTGSSRLEPATGLGLICRCLHQLWFRSEFKSFVDVP